MADHAPLREAAAQGEVVPLFVLEPQLFDPARAAPAGCRLHYLVAALAELRRSLQNLGSQLVLASGQSVEVVPRLARAWKVDRVAAHRWVEPHGRARDRSVAAALAVPLELYEGETLHPPGTLRSSSGQPYAIFTPFARALGRAEQIAPPRPPPRLGPLPVKASSAPLPTLAHRSGLLLAGEAAARARLEAFDPTAYADLRDRLDLAATSRLSADLHFGTLSVREVWARTHHAPAFANELLWRDYAHSTLWDQPHALDRPLRGGWAAFPCRDDEPGWHAWTQGLTGYPVVDAAARQLLAEGFVHNRARMIAASFLTRHLMIDLRRGEAWYLRHLVDADLANNDAGWQWSFGSGLDAQPYFRVFSPLAQAERFDPHGAYVARWVPELAEVPMPWRHRPWQAPRRVDYPRPIVDHPLARDRFIATARTMLRGGPALTRR